MLIRRLKKYFTIGTKKILKEKDLNDKPLEYLLIAKEDEHGYFSVKLPILFAGLGIIIPIYIAVQTRANSGQMNNLSLLIFYLIALLFTIRLGKLFYDLDQNNKITSENLETYNKVILKKIKEKEKSEKEYKEKITNLLEKISENIKQK